MKKLSWFNRVVVAVNIGIALLLLISLIVPNVPTAIIPILFAISLVVPILVILNLFFTIYWALKRKRLFLISGSLLLIWYFLLGPFYMIFPDSGEEINNKEAISIMSFNVRSFNKYGWIKNERLDNEIISFVESNDPDIVCFQEFSLIKKENFSDYPFSYETPSGTNKSFQIVFSKYPILDGNSLDFNGTKNNGLYMDIIFKMDTIRMYNVHLQSFSIVPDLDVIKNEESSKLISKTSSAMLKQYEQASLIRENMDKTTHRKIVVGDFNNTQYSNVYQIIKGDMKDTYLEKGKGFGRTYDLLKFPIRIDYILADPEFEVLSHQNFNEKLSDHYPVMSTLRLKSH